MINSVAMREHPEGQRWENLRGRSSWINQLFLLHLHAVGCCLQHLFKTGGRKAVTLDLAYFPTCPLISKQMAKKKSGLEGGKSTQLLNNREKSFIWKLQWPKETGIATILEHQGLIINKDDALRSLLNVICNKIKGWCCAKQRTHWVLRHPNFYWSVYPQFLCRHLSSKPVWGISEVRGPDINQRYFLK